MKFCAYCEAPVESEDVFCSKCGHCILGCTIHLADAPVETFKEPRHKLFLELAYTGMLFWLPLIACQDEKNVRYHANQRLWLLILSIAACAGIRFFSVINDPLAGGLLGAVFRGIYSLLFILFLFGMLFLLWSAMTRAIAIHRDEEVAPVLFFDKVPLICIEKQEVC